MSMGKEISVPPPARALTKPAATAANPISTYSSPLIPPIAVNIPQAIVPGEYFPGAVGIETGAELYRILFNQTVEYML